MQGTTSELKEEYAIAKKKLEVVINKAENYILVFSDLSGSTLLSRRNLVEYFETFIDHVISAQRKLGSKTHKRTVVKTIGDEVMLTQIISESSEELECTLTKVIKAAVRFQMHLKKLKIIPAKVGIHLCKEVIPDKVIRKEINNNKIRGLPVHRGDILGKDVALAARIMNIAEKKQILISKAIFDNLPSDWKSKGEANETISFNLDREQVNLRIGFPMEFYFNGFHEDYDKTEKVRQVIYNKENPALIETGYPFLCLTNFDIHPDKIDETINAVKDVFPTPSILCVLERTCTLHPVEDREDPYSYPLSVIFATQSYNVYRGLSAKLKESLDLTTYSHFFYKPPNWIKWPIFRNYEKYKDNELGLCLWRCPNFKESNNLSEKIKVTTECLTDLIITGYYDNFTILPSAEKSLIDGLVGSLLGEKKLRKNNPLHAWGVKIREINKNFYA